MTSSFIGAGFPVAGYWQSGYHAWLAECFAVFVGIDLSTGAAWCQVPDSWVPEWLWPVESEQEGGGE